MTWHGRIGNHDKRVQRARCQNQMTTALAGQHVPIAAMHTILGSLGGALAVAGTAGGATAPCSRTPPGPHS